MLALLNKEFVVNFWTNFIGTLILIFSSLITTTYQIPIYLSVFFVLLFVRNGDGKDELNRSDRLISSLPVSRTQILASKIIYGFSIGLVFLLIQTAFNYFIPGLTSNSLSEIIGILILIVFLLTAYQMFYLIFGPQIMNYIIILIFFAFITIIPIMINTGQFNRFFEFISQYNLNIIFMSVSVLMLMLTGLMFTINIKLYNSKDL